MAERMFILCELRKWGGADTKGCHFYKPIDDKEGEIIAVPPERVLTEGHLRHKISLLHLEGWTVDDAMKNLIDNCKEK